MLQSFMGHAMDGLENKASVLSWDQWPQPPGGGITQNARPLQLTGLSLVGRETYRPALFPGNLSDPPEVGGQSRAQRGWHQGSHWRSGESISYHILLSRQVLYIGCEFCHIGQMTTLACCPRVCSMCQGSHQGLVVRKNCEGPSLKNVPEMP
jgi:hypothetical protein